MRVFRAVEYDLNLCKKRGSAFKNGLAFCGHLVCPTKAGPFLKSTSIGRFCTIQIMKQNDYYSISKFPSLRHRVMVTLLKICHYAGKGTARLGKHPKKVAESKEKICGNILFPAHPSRSIKKELPVWAAPV